MANYTIDDYTFQNADTMYGASPSQKSNQSINASIGNTPTRIPAIVQSYDYNSNLVVVKIAIKMQRPMRDSNGDFVSVEKALVRTSVKQPISNLSGGGIGIFFPVTTGDIGWLEVADRDTSNFKESDMKNSVSPRTLSGKEFNFGSFTPDVIKGVKVASTDYGKLLITNIEGTAKITISPSGEIEIVAPDSIKITSPDIEITAETQIKATTPNFIIDGTLTVSEDVIANEISLVSHTHGGVTTGAGNTSIPNK